MEDKSRKRKYPAGSMYLRDDRPDSLFAMTKNLTMDRLAKENNMMESFIALGAGIPGVALYYYNGKKWVILRGNVTETS